MLKLNVEHSLMSRTGSSREKCRLKSFNNFNCRRLQNQIHGGNVILHRSWFSRGSLWSRCRQAFGFQLRHPRTKNSAEWPTISSSMWKTCTFCKAHTSDRQRLSLQIVESRITRIWSQAKWICYDNLIVAWSYMMLHDATWCDMGVLVKSEKSSSRS